LQNISKADDPHLKKLLERKAMIEKMISNLDKHIEGAEQEIEEEELTMQKEIVENQQIIRDIRNSQSLLD